jgi:surface protein
VATKYQHIRSNVAGKVPTPADLEVGEIAVNFADKKVFTKEPGGTIVELGGGGDCGGPGECLQQDLGNVTGAVDMDVSQGRTVLAEQTGDITALTVTDTVNPLVGWLRLEIKSNGDPISFDFVESWWGTQPTKLQPGVHTLDFIKVNGIWHGSYNGMAIETAGKRPFRMTVRMAAPNQVYTLPLHGTMAVEIDWGDNTKSKVAVAGAPELTHTYTQAKDYQIAIRGTASALGIASANTALPVADATPVISVDAWGDLGFTDLTSAFHGCVNLVHVASGDDKGAGDIKGVISMSAAFRGCTSFIVMPLLDVSASRQFDNTFRDCTSLKTIAHWDTSGAVAGNYGFSNMFYGCSSLQRCPVFDLGDATTLAGMFTNCTNLGALPHFDTSKITTMYGFASGCKSITSIPVYDTSLCKTFGTAFSGCESLISFPHLDMSVTTDISFMCNNCTSLQTFPKISMPEVTNTQNAVSGCSALMSFPATSLPKCTNAYRMFENCISLQQAGPLTFTVAETLQKLFEGCVNLTSGDIVNTRTVKNWRNTYSNCKKLPAIPPGLNFQSAEECTNTFYNCEMIKEFPAITFPASVVNSTTTLAAGGFANMFYGCKLLVDFKGRFQNTTTGSFLDAFSHTKLSGASKDQILADLVAANTGLPAGDNPALTPTLTITDEPTGAAATPPSAAGLANAATLTTRGWTVNAT